MDQEEEVTQEFPVEALTVSEGGAAEVKGGAEAVAGKSKFIEFTIKKATD